MFRQITAILLLTAFAAQVFNRAVIVLDYYTNTTAFAKHCENKARPMMHCNGKCQLMKKLQEEDKKEQQAPERKIQNQVELVSSVSHFAVLKTYQPRSLLVHAEHHPSFSRQSSYAEIFRPPALG